MRDDFPEADFAILKNNFLLLISPKIYTSTELEKIRERYNVFAVVKGDLSNFSGFIYTGKEDSLRV